MKRQNPIIPIISLLAAALPLIAQENKPGEMPDKPVTKEQLTPEAYQAFKAPLEAMVTGNALQRKPSPPMGFGTALNHYYHSNVYNHEHGGFEPMALRPKYRAEGTDWDSVVLNEKLAQNVREGLYDGARVRVYQAVNGKLVKIRDTKIAPGGHQASDWLETRGNVNTLKGKTDFKMALDSSFLPHREYWFCVKAIDNFGQLSKPSNVVSLKTGEAKGQVTAEDYAPWQRFDDQNPDKPAPPPAPQNLRVTVEGDVARFEWDPVESEYLRGYKIMVSPVPPQKIKGYRLKLTDRQPRPDRPIQKGDIVFVDSEARTFTQDMISPYVSWPALRQIHPVFNSWMLGQYKFWSDGSDYPAKWELVPHPEPVPAEFVARGQTCLKWQVDGNELTGFMLGPNGGTQKENNWYTPLMPGEYVVEAWLRGSGKAQIAFAGIHANPGTPLPFNQRVPAQNPHAIAPVELPVTDQWRKVTGTFTVKSVPESGLGHILFTYQGPGTLYLDDLRIYRKNTVPYGVLHAPFINSMRESGARFMRTHELIRTKLGLTLNEVTLPAGGAAISFTGYRSKPTTFHTLLDSIKHCGRSPRLQVEMCLSDEEWLGLAEWLFAPYDPAKGDTPAKKPWAYRRWSLGQQKPWIEEFPEFALEISNETWNQTYAPYDWDWGAHVLVDGANGQAYSYGATYGLFQQYVIERLKSSPYWNDKIARKMSFPITGWTVAPSFGAEAARYSPDSKVVDYANYLGARGLGDPKTMTDFKRFYMMQWALSGVEGQVKKCMEFEKALRADGIEVESGIYEYGVLYTAPAPAEITEAENQFGRATTAAVAALDATLKAVSLGFQSLHYFTFAPQIGAWGSHTEERFGGHAYPFFKALTLYNRYGTGQLLGVELKQTPRWDFPAYKTLDNTTEVKRDALPQAPLVSVYASAAGDRVSVFLISRKLDDFPITGDDGFTPATIQLPFAQAKKITLHKLVGDPRVDDRFTENTKVETVNIPATGFRGVLPINEQTGADARGLPPASIFCYVFEGVNAGKPNLPPVARFEIPDQIVVGEPATLKGMSGDDVTYAWDLGQAGKSAERNPRVTFDEARMTDISLTVTDKSGLSDTLTRKRYPVGARFGGEVWWPWSIDFFKKDSGGRGKLNTAGALEVRGSFPASSQGLYSLLRAAPRFQKDFIFEATIAGVEGQGNDPRLVGGLTLITNRRTGLGFSEFDFESLQTVASLLIAPNGAVRKLKGRGEELDELLPAGSVQFPVKARLVVKGAKAVAAVEQGGAWKELATFDLPTDIGLMPALAAASHHAPITTMTVTACKISP